MNHLEKCLDFYLKEGLVTNVAIRVGKGDNVLIDYYKSANTSLNENVLFDMASVTKIFVSVLATIAIDQGLITPNTKVDLFYPCPEDKKNLTIENLLVHTNGSGHYSICKPENNYNNIWKFILNHENEIDIGKGFLYSCPGYILLGKILEKLFDDRLDLLIQKYITIPLDMTSTGYLPLNGSFVNSNICEDEKGMVNDYNCKFLGGIAGNAGIFSNIKDMTKYVHFLIRHGNPLLSSNAFERSVTNYTKSLSESRGWGFLYVDEKYHQTGSLFKDGSIGHCGHTGQSVFVDYSSGFYAIILSDATVSISKKYGAGNYNLVMKFREDIHNAVANDVGMSRWQCF